MHSLALRWLSGDLNCLFSHFSSRAPAGLRRPVLCFWWRAVLGQRRHSDAAPDSCCGSRWAWKVSEGDLQCVHMPREHMQPYSTLLHYLICTRPIFFVCSWAAATLRAVSQQPCCARFNCVQQCAEFCCSFHHSERLLKVCSLVLLLQLVLLRASKLW